MSKEGQQISEYLNSYGLNIQVSASPSLLPNGHSHELKNLLIIGHGGKELWNALTPEDFSCKNPIDDYSVEKFKMAFQKYAPTHKIDFLFPSSTPINLGVLMDKTGICTPSPLGIGINSEYGPWFGIRVVALTTLETGWEPIQEPTSPCDNCLDKPCLSACPASAVNLTKFQLGNCIDYRLKKNSECSTQCLSRQSCPYKKEHRYSNEQIQYHSQVSYHYLNN